VQAHIPFHVRPGRAVASLASLLLLVAALTACGSSASAATSATSSATIQHDCTLIADTLSDGPDPDADPIGYAQAQILPLGQLQLTNPTLRSEVKGLIAAYKAYTGNSTTANALAASNAEEKIDAACPGGLDGQVAPGQAVP
jgi:hypothetical protein